MFDKATLYVIAAVLAVISAFIDVVIVEYLVELFVMDHRIGYFVILYLASFDSIKRILER